MPVSAIVIVLPASVITDFVRLVPPAEIEKFAFVKSGFALKVLVVVITKVGFTCPLVIVDVDAITGGTQPADEITKLKVLLFSV